MRWVPLFWSTPCLRRHRFTAAARACSDAMRDAVRDDDLDRPATGPIWVGGFSFFADGGTGPAWSSFPPTALSLPELSLTRSGGVAHATLNVMCRAGDDPDALAARAAARLATLQTDALPLVDPDPAGGYEIESVLPPTDFERAVEEGARHVGAGAIEKLVLAREVQVTAARPFNPAAVFGALRSAYPSCYCFCVGTPEAAFVGASPELLVRRAGAVLSTVALAGSTRRSADPAVDDHLGERLLHSTKDREEHGIVVQHDRALSGAAVGLGGAGPGARARQGRQHPAPRDAGARAARPAAQRGRAGGRAAPDLRGRR